MHPIKDTDNLSRVVAAIRSGDVETREGGHLVLPAGLSWRMTGGGNALFVPRVAAPLFESILNKCMPVEVPAGSFRDWEHERHVVTGQPGIGKSMWA